MKYLVACFLIIILIVAGCRSPRKVFVTERDALKKHSVTADTTMADEKMTFDERSEIYYHFEHDNSNLYITLATFNQSLQRKIVHFGFTVWIDISGGDSKKQGFKFPVGVRVPGDNDAGSINLSLMGYKVGPVESLLQRADEIDLIGIYGSSVRRVNKRDSRIIVKAERVNDMLLYEAIVPYDLLKHGFNPVTHSSTVGIGFETGYFEVPDTRPGQFRQPAPGVMGPAGRSPVYTPGRMPDQSAYERDSREMGDLSRPTELWLELIFTPELQTDNY